jgi:hypothetical protein
LPATSSLTAKYIPVSMTYLSPVGNFISCSFGHLTSVCITPDFYRRTLESIPTGSSAVCKTLNVSTHTGNIACLVTCWSLSLCSVHCSLPSLSLCSLPPLCSGNERPGPRTTLNQNDAAGSLSCHFNTVLYPRSYSQCQLPLNRSRRYIPGAAFSVQNYRNFLTVTTLSSLAPLLISSTYICINI